MTKYYIESFKRSGSPKFVIRQREGKLIERYDFMKQKWVEDDYMLKIYTGGIEVDPCTEADALAEIKAAEEELGTRKKGKEYGG